MAADALAPYISKSSATMALTITWKIMWLLSSTRKDFSHLHHIHVDSKCFYNSPNKSSMASVNNAESISFQRCVAGLATSCQSQRGVPWPTPRKQNVTSCHWIVPPSLRAWPQHQRTTSSVPHMMCVARSSQNKGRRPCHDDSHHPWCLVSPPGKLT